MQIWPTPNFEPLQCWLGGRRSKLISTKTVGMCISLIFLSTQAQSEGIKLFPPPLGAPTKSHASPPPIHPPTEPAAKEEID
jgi:hypothetical protein